MSFRRALARMAVSCVLGCEGGETTPPRWPEAPPPEPDAAAPCVPVAGSFPIDLVGGEGTFLFLFDDGTVWCGGDNWSGQCSADLYDEQPIRIARLGCATQVAMGRTGLAILRDGRVQSWGSDLYETLGDGPGSDAALDEVSFVLLEQPARFVDVSFQMAGAVAESGDAYWWGELYDQPQSWTRSDTPAKVELQSVVELRAEVSGSCARDDQGRVFCFGANGFGQLGQPDIERSTVPLQVPLPEPAVGLSDSGLTMCALLESGRVHCWGSNFVGELGRGLGVGALKFDHHPAPVLVEEPLLGIAGGGEGTCGWTVEGRVYCWGSNSIYRFWPDDPSLGDTSDGLPRRVPVVEPARKVALTKYDICALGFDDEVRCRRPASRGDIAYEVKFEEDPPGG